MTSFTIDDFLAEADVQEIDWVRPSGAPTALNPLRVDIGWGPDALEVAVATSDAPPRMDDVRRLWSLRWNRRAAPVLLVVGYEGASGWEATVCGPGDDPAAIPGMELSQVERICAAALTAPNASEAKRTLQRLLVGTKDQLIAGLINQGLFASHELRHGVPARPDWEDARTRGAALLGLQGADLIAGLGYTSTAHGSVAQVLSTGNKRHAVAVLLNENELFDRPGDRFGAVSPVTQGLALAQEQNLPWLVVMRGTQIRLYSAKPDVGVGRKGQSETYVELDLALLTEPDAGYLPLLFASTALDEDGSVNSILTASVDHAAGLGARLRDRVYVDVVPSLAVAVANALREEKGSDLDEADLHEAYHRTLIILFRLLFVAYAEDRGLLPYQRNVRYTKKALKTLAREFTEDADLTFDPDAYDRWEDLKSVWRAVDDGNSEWDVPAYNGGLFAADPELHPSGYAISQMRLSNAEIGPALKALLIDKGNDGNVGPVDFRSLSVREFGTIYEGLLESSLSVAPNDLTVDTKTKAYLPATKGAPVVVRAGDIYFHNASGARKSTGSYFTKAFAVEHLLDTALEPALTDHLAAVRELLEGGDEAGAADKFFDFRVADLAMGSGHFLVAAIDRIENRFAKFLTENPIARVNDELTRLAAAAAEALGEAAREVEIESSMLLRRQIARRCIYGLDLNLMAVELARLAIWIHTFVPGLPMSSLNHGLRVGNSLTGIGTVDEVLDVLEPGRDAGQVSFYAEQIEQELQRARQSLVRVALTSEATKSQVAEAARVHARAMAEADDARALMDAAIMVRLGDEPMPSGPDDAIEIGNKSEVRERINSLKAAHMPYLFPEVFLRDNPGFDVLLGNPPWEKVKVEKSRWWALRFPGLRSYSQGEQDRLIRDYEISRPDLAAEYENDCALAEDMRNVLARGPFPGLGRGDTDLYKGFAWRMYTLVRVGGRAGCVYPRSLLAESGTAKWREKMFDSGEFHEVTMLVNTSGWVFDEVHPQYSIALIAMSRSLKPAAEVVLRGPFHSLSEYKKGTIENPSRFPAQDFRDWGTDAAFPLLPSPRSGEVFLKLHQHPRLDAIEGDWRARPYAELHSTADKKYFNLAQTGAGEGWPVYKGESFDLWSPDTGVYYGRTVPDEIIQVLQAKRLKGVRNSRSPFSEFKPTDVRSADSLPCMSPRIALRKVTRATDTRTVRAALVPPHVVLADGAPFLLFPKGDATDEAFLLGVLSSIPLDWNARRVIEVNMTYHPLNGFPIPRPLRENPLRQRVVEIAGRMAAVDGRYSDWAASVGVPVGSVSDEKTKGALIAELDALVSLLYGLESEDVEHIFDTFHRGWDYRERLRATLEHFEAWQERASK